MQFDQLKRRDFITQLGGAAARGARAAVGDAGDRLSQRAFVGAISAPVAAALLRVAGFLLRRSGSSGLIYYGTSGT